LDNKKVFFQSWGYNCYNKYLYWYKDWFQTQKMQVPKSPEKTTRVRTKTVKSQNETFYDGGRGAANHGVIADKVGAAEVAGRCAATNKIVRKQKNPKTTQINPKTTKTTKTTDQQFYNEEDSEFEEDEQYTTLDTFSHEVAGAFGATPFGGGREAATRSSRNQSDFETKSKRAGYPDLINKMLVLCVNEKDFIKGTCAGRIKSHYQKVFQTYKDKMEPRDRAIINSGLNYIYNFNRSNSIPKENAIWLISINDIPISHIVSYTSKNTLKEIAKDYGISCSNKKAEELIANIREAVEKN
jgi:hypothetical protein